MKKKELEQLKSRILARRLARPLNEEEMEIVAGAAMILSVSASGSGRLADTWSCTGCPANDCDS
jgi:hypothetical protein